MSATADENARADLACALIQETVDKLASWLTKDAAVMPGSDAQTSAEWLALYFLLIVAMRRRGAEGLAFMLEAVEDMVEQLGGGA